MFVHRPLYPEDLRIPQRRLVRMLALRPAIVVRDRWRLERSSACTPAIADIRLADLIGKGLAVCHRSEDAARVILTDAGRDMAERLARRQAVGVPT